MSDVQSILRAAALGDVVALLSVVRTKPHLFSDPNIAATICHPTTGWTAVHFATEGRHHESIALLLSRCPGLLNAADSCGYTPLEWAAFYNDPATVALLLRFATPVTALHEAEKIALSYHRNLALFEVLRAHRHRHGLPPSSLVSADGSALQQDRGGPRGGVVPVANHLVQQNESLEDIAFQYTTTYAELRYLNGDRLDVFDFPNNRVKAGAIIRVPLRQVNGSDALPEVRHLSTRRGAAGDTARILQQHVYAEDEAEDEARRNRQIGAEGWSSQRKGRHGAGTATHEVTRRRAPASEEDDDGGNRWWQDDRTHTTTTTKRYTDTIEETDSTGRRKQRVGDRHLRAPTDRDYELDEDEHNRRRYGKNEQDQRSSRNRTSASDYHRKDNIRKQRRYGDYGDDDDDDRDYGVDVDDGHVHSDSDSEDDRELQKLDEEHRQARRQRAADRDQKDQAWAERQRAFNEEMAALKQRNDAEGQAKLRERHQRDEEQYMRERAAQDEHERQLEEQQERRRQQLREKYERKEQMSRDRHQEEMRLLAEQRRDRERQLNEDAEKARRRNDAETVRTLDEERQRADAESRKREEELEREQRRREESWDRRKEAHERRRQAEATRREREVQHRRALDEAAANRDEQRMLAQLESARQARDQEDDDFDRMRWESEQKAKHRRAQREEERRQRMLEAEDRAASDRAQMEAQLEANERRDRKLQEDLQRARDNGDARRARELEEQAEFHRELDQRRFQRTRDQEEWAQRQHDLELRRFERSLRITETAEYENDEERRRRQSHEELQAQKAFEERIRREDESRRREHERIRLEEQDRLRRIDEAKRKGDSERERQLLEEQDRSDRAAANRAQQLKAADRRRQEEYESLMLEMRERHEQERLKSEKDRAGLSEVQRQRRQELEEERRKQMRAKQDADRLRQIEAAQARGDQQHADKLRREHELERRRMEEERLKFEEQDLRDQRNFERETARRTRALGTSATSEKDAAEELAEAREAERWASIEDDLRRSIAHAQRQHDEEQRSEEFERSQRESERQQLDAERRRLLAEARARNDTAREQQLLRELERQREADDAARQHEELVRARRQERLEQEMKRMQLEADIAAKKRQQQKEAAERRERDRLNASRAQQNQKDYRAQQRAKDREALRTAQLEAQEVALEEDALLEEEDLRRREQRRAASAERQRKKREEDERLAEEKRRKAMDAAKNRVLSRKTAERKQREEEQKKEEAARKKREEEKNRLRDDASFRDEIERIRREAREAKVTSPLGSPRSTSQEDDESRKRAEKRAKELDRAKEFAAKTRLEKLDQARKQAARDRAIALRQQAAEQEKAEQERKKRIVHQAHLEEIRKREEEDALRRTAREEQLRREREQAATNQLKQKESAAARAAEADSSRIAAARQQKMTLREQREALLAADLDDPLAAPLDDRFVQRKSTVTTTTVVDTKRTVVRSPADLLEARTQYARKTREMNLAKQQGRAYSPEAQVLGTASSITLVNRSSTYTTEYGHNKWAAPRLIPLPLIPVPGDTIVLAQLHPRVAPPHRTIAAEGPPMAVEPVAAPVNRPHAPPTPDEIARAQRNVLQSQNESGHQHVHLPEEEGISRQEAINNIIAMQTTNPSMMAGGGGHVLMIVGDFGQDVLGGTGLSSTGIDVIAMERSVALAASLFIGAGFEVVLLAEPCGPQSPDAWTAHANPFSPHSHQPNDDGAARFHGHYISGPATRSNVIATAETLQREASSVGGGIGTLLLYVTAPICRASPETGDAMLQMYEGTAVTTAELSSLVSRPGSQAPGILVIDGFLPSATAAGVEESYCTSITNAVRSAYAIGLQRAKQHQQHVDNQLAMQIYAKRSLPMLDGVLVDGMLAEALKSAHHQGSVFEGDAMTQNLNGGPLNAVAIGADGALRIGEMLDRVAAAYGETSRDAMADDPVGTGAVRMAAGRAVAIGDGGAPHTVVIPFDPSHRVSTQALFGPRAIVLSLQFDVTLRRSSFSGTPHRNAANYMFDVLRRTLSLHLHPASNEQELVIYGIPGETINLGNDALSVPSFVCDLDAEWIEGRLDDYLMEYTQYGRELYGSREEEVPPEGWRLRQWKMDASAAFVRWLLDRRDAARGRRSGNDRGEAACRSVTEQWVAHALRSVGQKLVATPPAPVEGEQNLSSPHIGRDNVSAAAAPSPGTSPNGRIKPDTVPQHLPSTRIQSVIPANGADLEAQAQGGGGSASMKLACYMAHGEHGVNPKKSLSVLALQNNHLLAAGDSILNNATEYYKDYQQAVSDFDPAGPPHADVVTVAVPLRLVVTDPRALAAGGGTAGGHCLAKLRAFMSCMPPNDGSVWSLDCGVDGSAAKAEHSAAVSAAVRIIDAAYR